MNLDDGEFERIIAGMMAKSIRLDREEMLRQARARIPEIRSRIEAVQIVVDGIMASIDRRFKPTSTFLPSSMIRAQLRLALHYLHAADHRESDDDSPGDPTLSSYVVLRAAIECTATAHWLLSGRNQRERVERVLKRMWWDTENAVHMAAIADGAAEHSASEDLRQRIEAICRPVKGLEATNVMNSKRVQLSTVVKDASAALRPDQPTMMYAGWMLCSGVAHGNIPISAGVGITPETVQLPSLHPMDMVAFAPVFAAICEEVELTIGLFETCASEQHAHRPQHLDDPPREA